jgi:hypothetical protein
MLIPDQDLVHPFLAQQVVLQIRSILLHPRCRRSVHPLELVRPLSTGLLLLQALELLHLTLLLFFFAELVKLLLFFELYGVVIV